MFTVAPVSGSWQLSEALQRCERAREQIERTLIELRAIGEDCPWKAKPIELLREECVEQRRELLGVLDQLRSFESSLPVG